MYNCDLCLYSTDCPSNFKKHNNTKKHTIRVYQKSLNNICYDINAHTVLENGVQNSKKCQQIENLSENLGKKIDKNDKKREKSSTVTKKYKNLEETEYLNTDDKLISKYICEVCQKTYKSRQNLWDHKQTKGCKKRHEEHENQLKINSLQEQINEMKKQMNKISTNKKTNQIINNNNCSNNNNTTNIINNDNSINVLNYVVNAFSDTLPLKKITNVEISKMLEITDNKYTIVDYIAHHYIKYDLDAFFGKIIIKAYKKENPEEQQFWTSSTHYLTFIVRQLLNKKPIWFKDREGTCVNDHIINPFLLEVKKILQDYCKSIAFLIVGKSIEDIERIQENGYNVIKIIREINTNTLHKQILKYIAPEFQITGDIDLIENVETSVVVMSKSGTGEKKPTKKSKLSQKNNCDIRKQCYQTLKTNKKYKLLVQQTMKNMYYV